MRAFVPLNLCQTSAKTLSTLAPKIYSRNVAIATRIRYYTQNSNTAEDSNFSFSYTHFTGGVQNRSRERERTHTRNPRTRGRKLNRGLTFSCCGQASDDASVSLSYSRSVTTRSVASIGTLLPGSLPHSHSHKNPRARIGAALSLLRDAR